MSGPCNIFLYASQPQGLVDRSSQDHHRLCPNEDHAQDAKGDTTRLHFRSKQHFFQHVWPIEAAPFIHRVTVTVLMLGLIGLLVGEIQQRRIARHGRDLDECIRQRQPLHREHVLMYLRHALEQDKNRNNDP